MPIDIIFPIKWQDVVDILVISLILHRLFLFFRGTVALQIIVGLLFLWLFHGIAQAIGLILTSWFFQGLGAIAVIVIVVVFRDEIRAMLVQTNPVRFFLGHPYQTHTVNIPLLIQAIFQLAESRTGALIVFKRRDKLDGHLHEGVPIDSRFTPEIISSIFGKHSPVHDGATIIRGDRIAIAGTFLPLTQKQGLPQHFGTRHRAAIGITEVSDAVVIVVSEERGEITVVHGGNVKTIQKEYQLQQTLEQLLVGITPYAKPKRRYREWLTQCAGLLLTFLLVSTFWGVYSGKQYSLITVSVPVDFRNIPDSLELKKVSAEKVEIQISGNSRLVGALNPDDVRAFLDLKEISVGTHSLVLGTGNIKMPLGLEVVRVTPPAITLEMEPRIEKDVAIKPNIVGFPPPGYQLDRLSIDPAFVRVSGPASTLRSIGSILTEPIKLGKIQPNQEETSIDVSLVLSPASLRLLPGQKRGVRVSIYLQPQKSSLTDRKKTKTRFHRVRTGECLYTIARRYGLTVKQLRQFNNLTPGAIIYPGQKLHLETSP
jgi:uncharacterized protein (TIGR00159 family)